MDDHDKHRYNEEDVTELGGASWKETALSEADVKRGILSEIEEFIDAHEVTSYVRLCRYARNRRTEVAGYDSEQQLPPEGNSPVDAMGDSGRNFLRF